jgi:ketosteroid isomerase-like protein
VDCQAVEAVGLEEYAVSQHNVGLGRPPDAEAKVRAYFERFNETRESQLEALHPEIEWHIRADLPNSRTLHGYDDIKRRDADWIQAFGDLRLDPVDVSEVSGKTVVLVHFQGRVKGSGHVVDMTEVWVLGWRGDRLIEIREYKDEAEALKAVEQPE